MRSKLYPMQSYFVQHYSLYIIISVMSVAEFNFSSEDNICIFRVFGVSN